MDVVKYVLEKIVHTLVALCNTLDIVKLIYKPPLIKVIDYIGTFQSLIVILFASQLFNT